MKRNANSRDESVWVPQYTITPETARNLMAIEAAKAVVERTPLPPSAEDNLRLRARLRSTHFSTSIEGNRLSLREAGQVLVEQQRTFLGRERDVTEVRNYWIALLRVEEWAAKDMPLSGNLIRRIHALVENGPRAKPTPWRDGQNAIRDGATGEIVYLPPESADVPGLMTGLVRWEQAARSGGLPAPIIAGLAHYQFVTIHPFYDGNGRTARLLATFLLHSGGYGLNGIYSLEEYHAQDLDRYYQALVTHPHHHYYYGRETADLTGWVDYFVATLAAVFSAAKAEAEALSVSGAPEVPEAIRRLDHRARAVMALFSENERITSAGVARSLGLAERTARDLLAGWVRDGWLQVADPSHRARSYELTAEYRRLIGGLSAASAETTHLQRE